MERLLCWLDVRVWFFLMDEGHICTNQGPAKYEGNKLNKWKPLREIAFAYFHLWECTNSRLDIWELTNSAEIVRCPRSSLTEKPITSHFRYLMRHPPEDRRCTHMLDNMLETGYRHRRDFVVVVEIIEGLNTITIIGVVYSVIARDVGGGFGIASFAVTALAFAVAVIAAGEWLGLESLDSFTETDMWRGERLEGRVLRDEKVIGRDRSKKYKQQSGRLPLVI
ncbi:hypothetical protein AOQ84DRAFT_213759 [Glonium stellatum]|uniref:Uncharacterized protein n=1 Tax=Glonium stellatum TaxID=574774 RepID=A0A8E2END5_9PEZI|nr:hypothetical protein AOQ84DRAFT_213759 [Glonium stellatum]